MVLSGAPSAVNSDSVSVGESGVALRLPPQFKFAWPLVNIGQNASASSRTVFSSVFRAPTVNTILK